MKISDLFENKNSKSIKVPTSTPRNLVAKHSQSSGSGKHQSKKDRDSGRKPKHPHRQDDKY